MRVFTEPRESLASPSSPPTSITGNVLDSLIEEESVPAFLAGIAHRPNFSFHANMSWWFTDRKDHEARWYMMHI